MLGKFAPSEDPIVQAAIALSLEAIESCLRDGVAKAASLYNPRQAGTQAANPPKAKRDKPDAAPPDPQEVNP